MVVVTGNGWVEPTQPGGEGVARSAPEQQPAPMCPVWAVVCVRCPAVCMVHSVLWQMLFCCKWGRGDEVGWLVAVGLRSCDAAL